MKSLYILLGLLLILSLNINAQDYLTLQELSSQKETAVKNSHYRLAKVIQDEIDKREKAAGTINLSLKEQKSEQILALDKQQKDAVTKEDWLLAKSIKKQKGAVLGIIEKPIISSNSNFREQAYQEMKMTDYATVNSYIPTTINSINPTVEGNNFTKVKQAEDNIVGKDLKYRRSSLYTLMVNDLSRQHANVILNTFGNSTIPQKFNEHNIGPYLIDGQANSEDQSAIITNYLTTNNVAKNLIAKWFNRSADGKFNIDLVAARGMYDASAMDKVIANSTERGNAMLADAGEELIGNTFVIVNDFKFTNKEEAVAKGKKASGVAKGFAGMLPGGAAIQKGISAAETVATVAGKGYWVRTTSYLYRLVWDEEAAAIFYNNYWTDATNFDPAKVTAFNNANNFKLRLVGFQTAGADVQSSIFTNKSEEDLIRMATVKATDRAIAKLSRKYEEFRTKTPLYSSEPIAAKIGLKEGLEQGDKFEVLQQELTTEGKTIYTRVGVIKVDQVWDNSLSPEETEQLRQEGKLTGQQYTTFIGGGNFYPGQLIKQID